MKIQIIHFSDIHFKESENAILEKKDKLFDAIKNQIRKDELNILLVTGDSAFSGKKEEFKIAKIFYKELIDRVKTYNDSEIDIIVIPGNHDCTGLTGEDDVREVLLDRIQSGNGEIKEQLVSQISNPLTNYFEFESELNQAFECIYDSILLKAYKINVGKNELHLFCYNLAFQSVLNEKPGKMVFPIDLIDKKIFSESAAVKISCFHHPSHWLQPDHKRIFDSHIKDTSDFFLTGHEHVDGASIIKESDNVTYHIEGEALQDSDNEYNSGFNLIQVDLDQKQYKIDNYKWTDSKYLFKSSDWNPFERGKVETLNPYQISEVFSNYLNDIGANFTHPNRKKVFLNDVFINPDLELLYDPKDKNQTKYETTINLSEIFKNWFSSKRLIISGVENSGKTTLLKRTFSEFHSLKFIPIFIDGRLLRSTSIEEVEKVFSMSFLEQYISTQSEDYFQLDRSKIIILIDDFDKAKVNVKYKGKLIENLKKVFPNIVIVGNDLMSIEEIISDNYTKEDLYSDFVLYKVLDFGHTLRSKLINKWNILGVEYEITEDERILKLHNAEKIINTVIGANFVPSHPFFLLTILQSIELGNSTDLTASTFGHYYHYLINQSLVKVLTSQREITEYENYLSEFAFYLFENGNRELDDHELEVFDKTYRNNFTISHSTEKVIDNLTSAFLLFKKLDGLTFKYHYIYYYFVSNYLSNNLHDEKVRDKVNRLTDRLYESEFANIIMFLTHHSKDPFLLQQLLSKADSLLIEVEPSRLEEDIQPINKLGGEIFELVYVSREVEEYREEKNRELDEISKNDESEKDLSDLPNINESQEEDLDLIAELNVAFKTIEIIGQILKNNYGKIQNTVIEELIEKSIQLGLRALSMFFSIIGENTEFIVNHINYIISKLEEEKGDSIDEKRRLEKLSRNILFNVCAHLSHDFIKKVSDSIGTEHLHKILEKVCDKLDYNSVQLIKLSIKLDHYKAFPSNDLKQLKKRMFNSNLPLGIMKKMVINYLYLFPTTYDQKSKILSLLDIPMQEQLRIDRDSGKRKKGK